MAKSNVGGVKMGETHNSARLIRFPSEIEDRIEQIAREERRSFTQQVIFILAQWIGTNSCPNYNKESDLDQ